MKIFRDTASSTSSAVAIGVFDGLHRGHQKVLENLKEIASRHGVLSSVVTFDPHPAVALAPDRAPTQLATIEQRLEGLEALGIDQVRVLTFNAALAGETAESFIARVLVDEMKASHIVVGEDFRFGHDRQGNVAMLESLSEAYGFHVHPASIFGDNERWSSTSVRAALSKGNLDIANEILGRPFVLRGTVVHGDARGAELGYPTANIYSHPRQQLPAIGIYAGATKTEDGQWLPAAISVGKRPQFYEDGQLLVEVHIPGFSGDLYDKVLDTAFLGHLRGEMTFDGVDALIAQIDRDVAESLNIFKSFRPETSILLR